MAGRLSASLVFIQLPMQSLKGKRRKPKQYVVRKYVMALSARDALKREKNVDTDDVWLDQEWVKAQPDAVGTMGFVKKDEE